MIKKFKKRDIDSLHKSPKHKTTNQSTIPANQSKSKQKTITNKLSTKNIKEKSSTKTSLQQRLKNTDQIDRKAGQKILTQSVQQDPDHHQKNLFKNTEIKKSIELHKNQLTKIRQKTKRMARSSTSQEKEQRDAYYGNTTTSNTKSGKKSSQSKFSSRQKQKKSSSKNQVNQNKLTNKLSQNNKKHSLSSNIESSPDVLHSPNLGLKKQTTTKRKQQRRLKKIESQYLRLLQDRLQQKQAELNTIKTRNLLEQTRGIGGWIDELTEEEIKRLKRIHRTQQEILDGQISQLKRQILEICQHEKNQMYRFGGNYYGCDDVMSWIQTKD